MIKCKTAWKLLMDVCCKNEYYLFTVYGMPDSTMYVLFYFPLDPIN